MVPNRSREMIRRRDDGDETFAEMDSSCSVSGRTTARLTGPTAKEDLSLAQIGKKEAVERVLVQAVKLQFNDGDEFATQLLLISALRICRDIIVNNKPDYDLFSLLIRPERLKEVLSKLSEVANYLKHANKDGNLNLDVPENIAEQNELLILITCGYFELAFDTATNNIFIHLAMMVMIKKWPNFFIETPPLPRYGDNYFRNADLGELYSLMKAAIQNPSEAARATRGWQEYRWLGANTNLSPMHKQKQGVH